MSQPRPPENAGAPAGEANVRPTWSETERPLPRLVVRPLQAFLETERSGAILLLLAAATALIWANSPWSATYDRILHERLTIGVGRWAISEDLQHWVNDGLMALFFYVVGLEIKREFVSGHLRDRRTAMLPVVAALGGMVVPALVYLAFNPTGAASRGWGIPMATDIAFALGVLAMVGRGLPSSLKPYLLTLAIVDDIGAILVIAVFYSEGVSWQSLSVAIALLVLIVVLQRLDVRWTAVYVFLGIAVWVATFESGVHATIAGVALGLLTPAAPFQRPRAVSDEAHRVANETLDDPTSPDADAHHWLHLAALSREAVSPLARLEHLLHPWTSYLVLPIFALANAGVPLTGGSLTAVAGNSVTIGIVVGLVLGKIVGIVGTSRLAVTIGIATKPPDVTWQHLSGVAGLAGIGFTVSLFITGLAFVAPSLETAAKIGILVASLLAGLLGAILLLRAPKRMVNEDAAT